MEDIRLMLAHLCHSNMGKYNLFHWYTDPALSFFVSLLESSMSNITKWVLPYISFHILFESLVTVFDNLDTKQLHSYTSMGFTIKLLYSSLIGLCLVYHFKLWQLLSCQLMYSWTTILCVDPLLCPLGPAINSKRPLPEWLKRRTKTNHTRCA